MARKKSTTSGLSVKSYRGDAKTLLAFNLPDRESARNLAGFTIQVQPPGQAPFYLWNSLQFEKPGDHAHVAAEPAYSSINAPFHKFRWLHVPGSTHTTTVEFGQYVYRVTPRFFDDHQSLLPIDANRTIATEVDVQPFRVKGVELGFTRGFVQSQAFVDHFGLKAPLRPPGKELTYDTSQVAGTNSQGKSFTFEDQYTWSGFTARVKILGLLDEVLADKSLHLDVFAYDLSEPQVITSLLQLAKEGRVRVILDNASLHKSTAKKAAPEDLFEKSFNQVAKAGAAIKRGKFGRYSHDKVMIVSDTSGGRKVLTGSTNFSITGIYVNSNHVIIFDDPKVASQYRDVFDASWNGDVKLKTFLATKLSTQVFSATSNQTPVTEITFSPHGADFAEKILDGLVDRVRQEAKTTNGSVFFAVMELDTKATGPVYPALRELHADQDIFSYGITDTTQGTQLYTSRSKKGVLVTGKPGSTQLPPPFNQIKQIGPGHQIHHKFVVCGFNGANPVVYCGSSNLALGGEEENGDNLIAIHDGGIATAFAIEALALVDHFDFLDKAASTKGRGKSKRKAVLSIAANSPSKRQLAASAGWFLGTTDAWVDSYYDPHDLHFVDRQLFG